MGSGTGLMLVELIKGNHPTAYGFNSSSCVSCLFTPVMLELIGTVAYEASNRRDSVCRYMVTLKHSNGVAFYWSDALQMVYTDESEFLTRADIAHQQESVRDRDDLFELLHDILSWADEVIAEEMLEKKKKNTGFMNKFINEYTSFDVHKSYSRLYYREGHHGHGNSLSASSSTTSLSSSGSPSHYPALPSTSNKDTRSRNRHVNTGASTNKNKDYKNAGNSSAQN